MDAGRMKNTLTTNVIGNGQNTISKAKANVTKNEPVKKAVTAKLPELNGKKEAGITTITAADGSQTKTADSGMERKNSADNVVEVKLPTGHVLRSSEKSESGFQVESDGKTTDAIPHENGLVAFFDKKGNAIIVDEKAMKYEVLNKHQNVTQIFEPDGSQTVMAFNRDKSGKDSVSEVSFDPQGNRLPNDTFQNLEIKADGRISFELNGHKTERTPGLALPGYPDPNIKSPAKSSPGNDMGPMVVLQEQPVLEPATFQSTAKTESAPSQKDSIFGGYPDISQDFRAGENTKFVKVLETESGVMARQESLKGLDTQEGQKESVWSYKLPNGHTFRTLGSTVETVGEDKGVKNARLVEENGTPVLAFSDKDGNRHRLDTAFGTYEVQNKQGSLVQSKAPNGSEKFTVQGTYTTETGKTEQYSQSVTFDSAGSVVANDGISDLAISEKGMTFTLPNGESTSRTLVAPTAMKIAPPAKAFDEGWDDGPSIAGRFTSSAATSSAGETPSSVPKESSAPTSFSERFGNEGWDVKERRHDYDFSPREIDGREVAFKAEDPATGEMVEHRGVLKANREPNKSALFGLVGQKGEFNNNYIDEMAVNKSFDKTFESSGWTVKSDDNYNDFRPQDLHGKEVAFRQPDPQTGQMKDHRGVLKANSDPNKSALFELVGQKGEFNNNFLKEIAVNDSFGTNFGKEGWTVKSDDNYNDFRPQDLHGKEVAFRQPDPQTGQMKDHRGVLKVNSDPNKSALFELVGQKGEFNNNYLREMAVNDSSGTDSSAASPNVSGSQAAFATHQAEGVAPAGQVKTPPPAHSKWGVSRVFLPGGGQITQLPNGITVTDGKELYAKDKDGNRLEVKKEAFEGPDGKSEHFLSFSNKDGVQYTMSDAHLNLIVQSKDNKVQQYVRENDSIINAVNDPITEGPYAGLSHKYLAEFPVSVRSPGMQPLEGFDPRFPDRMIAQGSPNGFYELPFPLPTPPGMRPGQGPGQSVNAQDPAAAHTTRTNKSVEPGMWQKVKNFFSGETNKAKPQAEDGKGDDVDTSTLDSGNQVNGSSYENPWNAGPQTGQQYGHGQPQFYGGQHYPGATHQVDPYAREMRSMQRGMAISNTISTAAVIAGFVFPGAFFFSPFGW